jgi:hypothetical protein
MSPADLSKFADALTTQIVLLPENSEERQAAAANLEAARAEQMRRDLARWQLEDNAEEIAQRPEGPPVVFAFDETTNKIYASVTANGATLAEVATYIYGAASQSGALANHNGLLASIRLGAGTPIMLIDGEQTAVANAAINAARKSGALLRTKGISDLGPKTDVVYLVPTPSGLTQVNDTQFDLMLRGVRRHTRNMLQIHVDSIKFLEGLRIDHEIGSDPLVRGISDWAGNASMPEIARYDRAIAQGNAILAKLDAVEFADMPRETAANLAELDQSASEVMFEEARIEGAWHDYIEGTIGGAEKAVRRLETVRNVSFTAVAGMAGAVAAPAAFAYLGTVGVTGATATGVSILAGGATGAAVRATAEVSLPGAQADKPWTQRAKSGAWTGFVAGGVGAAGSFLTPAVSGSVTGQLAARTSQQFVQSTAGQVVTRTATGVIIGAPSGAVSAGVENLPDLAHGRMSGGDYAAGIGWSTLGGGLAGGALSNLPIKGFSRDGLPFNPRAAPITPEWTMAGPYNPLARMTEYPAAGAQPPVAQPRGTNAGFHNLPPEALPAFANDPATAGYVWTRVRAGSADHWVPMRTYGPKQDFSLVWYADPANPGSLANYNFLYGPGTNLNTMRLATNRTVQLPAGQGYAGMQANDPFPGAPRSTRRDFPMSTDDFEVTMPDGSTMRMVRGHQTDYFDTTARTAQTPDSNLDLANFTPEPGPWGGLGGRNRLTMRIRASGSGTQVRQVNVYGNSTLATASGKPVPEAIYLIEVGPNGLPTRAWRVPFNDPTAFQGVNMHSPAALDTAFGVPNLASVPTPVQMDPALLPPSVAAMAVSQLDEQP